MSLPAKTDNGVLSYSIDYSSWLGSEGIASSVWEIESGSCSIVEEGVSGGITTIKVSGGVIGETCSFKNTIETTPGGLKDSRCFSIKIVSCR